MSAGKLVLECINGPLDGCRIELETATEWRRSGDGPLCFPWDEQLGDPQARFIPQEDGWWIESNIAAPDTYRIMSKTEKVTESVRLQKGNVIRASNSYLLVCFP